MPDHPKTCVILVRHGQARGPTPTTYEQSTLTETGRLQATAVADALRTDPPDVIYASPVVRATQTAEIIGAALSRKSVVETRLQEFSFGSSDQMANVETMISERTDLLVWQPDFRASADAETLRELMTRVGGLMEHVSEAHLGQRVLLVAHASAIYAAIRWAVGLTPDAIWTHQFPQPNASITEIDYWPRGRMERGAPRYAEFRQVGSVTHLGS